MRIRDMRCGPERMQERGTAVEHELLSAAGRIGAREWRPKQRRGFLAWTSTRYEMVGTPPVPVLRAVQGTLCYQPKDKRSRRERRFRAREWLKLERIAARDVFCYASAARKALAEDLVA